MGRSIHPAAGSRRAVMKELAIAAAGVLVYRAAPAAELKRLDVKDPDAVARGYVENAAQVNAGKYPSFVKGSSCENCLLLQGASGADYRPCSLFPGKAVAVRGWCSGWTAEI